jgi:hypothetical protein
VPELVAISEAMKNMKRANSGLTWIKQPHVRAFFEHLRAHGNVARPNLQVVGTPLLSAVLLTVTPIGSPPAPVTRTLIG